MALHYIPKMLEILTPSFLVVLILDLFFMVISFHFTNYIG